MYAKCFFIGQLKKVGHHHHPAIKTHVSMVMPLSAAFFSCPLMILIRL